MGQIADTLRATLRDLAQSDGRLYRGLQQELADPTPVRSGPGELLEGAELASREDLEGLSIKALWELCKARGIKGLSSGPKPRQVNALLTHPDGPPLRRSLPGKPLKGKAAAGSLTAPARSQQADLEAMERRLSRLEQLVVLIAQQVGVAQPAIDQLVPPAAEPPIS